MTVEANLSRLGITLPQPPQPVAAYVAWVRTGNLVLTSGQLPWVGDQTNEGWSPPAPIRPG